MRLGIMQPYFFPYAGYLALIAKTDSWIVFDTPQYTPKSWMNRNRVLHPGGGWMYITVPLQRSSQNMAIRDAQVADVAAARRMVIGKLAHYRKVAPHHAAVIRVVEEAFDRCQGDSLVSLNVGALEAVCAYLGIAFQHQVLSELDLSLPDITHPGAWAPAIAAAVGADSYVNAPGGRDLFTPEEFERNSIRLGFLVAPSFSYETAPYTFEDSMSILDVLMWNSAEAVAAAIDAADVEWVA